MSTDEIYCPCDVPVGRLELADDHTYSSVTFCETCRKRGTTECYICGENQVSASRYAYVSGAFPWNCIFCRRGRGGKPIKNWERDYTYDNCPYENCNHSDPDEAAKAHKWGCIHLELDGKHGEFCPAAVRRITVKPDCQCYASACGHYDWQVNADHAHPLWNKCEVTRHPMSFKCVRDYAKSCKCETLYDLLLAFDTQEFRDFCRKRHDRTVATAIGFIEAYAQVYGWFWIGETEGQRPAFRKGTPAEQNIRVAKTVAAVANKEARDKEAKKKSKKGTNT